MSSGVEIESADVIKVVLQFFKENGLIQSFDTLQNECQIALNTVASVEGFVSDVNKGRWDVILPQIQQFKLPTAKVEDLYELVVLEMLDLQEMDTARALLAQLHPLQEMRRTNPDRYQRLKSLCSKTYLEQKDLWGGVPRDKRRALIGHALSMEITTAPPQRLMTLLADALKWQQSNGQLPPGKPDVFRGISYGSSDEVEMYPTELAASIRFSTTHPEVAAFSYDGQYLVTGAADGMLEVWDPIKGKLNKLLKYQSDEQFMMHEHAVLCLAFSRDSEMLASGSSVGEVKVWRVRTGQRLRHYTQAHHKGVTSLQFSRDGGQLLSGSYDATAAIHGLRGGKLLKVFRGHTSFVNDAIYTPDGTRVVTASSDATVRVWDVRTCDCVQVFRPPQTTVGGELSVHTVLVHPQNTNHLLVSNSSNTVFVTTLEGEVVKSYQSGKKSGGDFVSMTTSPKGEFIYCLGEDGMLYCFGVVSGKLEHLMQVHDSNPIGVTHHPNRNLVATFSAEKVVKLWKPQ